MEKKEIKDFLRSNETIFMNRFVEPAVQEPHTHDFLELEYVISGEGMHRVGDTELPVSSGYVFFTNFDTPHCFLSADEKNPITLYNCVFTPESLRGAGLDFREFTAVANDMLYKIIFPQEFKNTPFLSVFDGSLKLKRLFEIMYQEYTEAQEGYNSVLLGCLIQLLIYFMRQYESQNRPDNTARSVQAKYIAQVMKYIETNYAERISLQELAAIALLSPNHLCKVFKDLTGITVSEYIQKLRLDKACELLSGTTLTLAEISNEVGYQDVGYLRRMFKKELGQTPSKYRAQKTENQHGTS